MIWSREEYIAHMNFEYTGREMFCELFGTLIGLDDEWRGQGATEDELNLSAFDWDYVIRNQVKVHNGARTGLEPRVIEDTPEHTVSIDRMGRKMRLCKESATIPLPLTHPVKNMDDWLKIKHWYEFDESRVDINALKESAKCQQKGQLLIGNMPGGFDEPRQLMGEEELCFAYYEQPELIHDMLSTMAQTCVKSFEIAEKYCKIDCLSVHEDLAGKSGPLVGPSIIEEFIKPYYRKVWDCVSSTGCSIFSQDSDGNMTAVIDAFIDCGVTNFYPLEPAAGMDIVKLREKYGNKISLKGGIDKHVLRGSKAEIRAELEYKMCEATMGGGTVFALDHRIPNGVSLENYKYYVNTGREILGREPVSGKGWARMAF